MTIGTAHDVGYLEWRDSRRNSERDLARRWRAMCAQERRPCLELVDRGMDRSTLRLDVSTSGGRIGEELRSRLADLLAERLPELGAGSSPCWSSTSLIVEHVPSSQGPALAEAVLEIIAG